MEVDCKARYLQEGRYLVFFTHYLGRKEIEIRLIKEATSLLSSHERRRYLRDKRQDTHTATTLAGVGKRARAVTSQACGL
jgi:hypothetical protein